MCAWYIFFRLRRGEMLDLFAHRLFLPCFLYTRDPTMYTCIHRSALLGKRSEHECTYTCTYMHTCTYTQCTHTTRCRGGLGRAHACIHHDGDKGMYRLIRQIDVDDASCEKEKPRSVACREKTRRLRRNTTLLRQPNAAAVCGGQKSPYKKRPPFFCALLVLVQRFPISFFHPG